MEPSTIFMGACTGQKGWWISLHAMLKLLFWAWFSWKQLVILMFHDTIHVHPMTFLKSDGQGSERPWPQHRGS